MKLAITALLAGSAAAFTSSPAPKSSVALHETKVRFAPDKNDLTLLLS